MTEDDLDGVVAIENISFTKPWSKVMFLGELANPVSNLFVAKAPGKTDKTGKPGKDAKETQDVVVGYAIFWVVVGEGHIMNISVAPEFRRQGIGRRMLRFTIEFMEQACVTVIFLEVRRTNHTAIKLYKDYGFEEVYVRKNYYGDEDALVMRLDPGGFAYPDEDYGD
ncbi:Ribosomal-protein-S18p-alanine acetyltransferase [hydrothermal vent metagenome]|uniref:Ribosomal-protein-S18p-alanine acetyltransferase n=1 Tax=hydrothermal vent metagenome TaxID=652676 RepID=A0A3B0QZF8_9ZZZZ